MPGWLWFSSARWSSQIRCDESPKRVSESRDGMTNIFSPRLAGREEVANCDPPKKLMLYLTHKDFR